jgi:ABC-type transport system involved in multi-copper enzyme maturation permease subunit
MARLSFREALRDRILWAFFGAALVMVCASLLLGTLTFAEQVKITVDLGLGMIHWLALALTIFLGVTVVGKEIRTRTVYSVLARPISRFEYLAGKYIGLMLTIAVSSLVLGVALLGLLAVLKTEATQSLYASVWSTLMEMAVVASFALLMSLIASPFVAAFATFGWWAAGSFSTDILFFASKAEDGAALWAGKIVYYLIPRLDLFQIKNRVVYEPSIEFTEIMRLTVYGATLGAILLVGALFVFQRKEL